MSGGGSKPGERRGGRKAGTPNRRTIERRLITEARADSKLLAKEVLEQNMLRYVELANSCLPPASGEWKKEQQFHFYTEKAGANARMLAPYQSPTYRSITVQAPRETAVRGTPAIDALEDFVLALARARKDQPNEPKTIEASAEETPTLV